MADVFSAPIPGQSLTNEPKNFPWERPPEISDPREAIKFHIDGLNKPETIDNVLELIQIGIPLRSLSETMLTTAQMEGIHSVDVSLIIRDVVYEELVSIAEEAGLDYKTGTEPSELDIKEKNDQQVLSLLRKKLAAIEPGSKEDDAGVELMRQTEQAMQSGGESDMDETMMHEGEESPEVEMMEEQVEVQQQEQPRGLMARG
jgi:hypothetical protein